MSSLKRLNLFRETILNKQLIASPQPSFNTYYKRLFLTRRAAEFILSAMIIFGGHQFVIINTFFSPIWPATGVALSALFLRGNVMLFGIFAGTLASFFQFNTLLTSIVQAILFTLNVYLIRACSLKLVGPITPLIDIMGFIKFILLCLFFCACHVSLVSYVFTQANHTVFLAYGWWVALLGEMNGILSLTPLCLAFDPFVIENYFNKKGAPWQLIAIAIILLHLLYFFIPSGAPSILLGLFCLGILCSYAVFFGLVPLCITLFSISIMYLAGALPGARLFHINATHSSTLTLLVILTLTFTFSLFIGIHKQLRAFLNYP